MTLKLKKLTLSQLENEKSNTVYLQNITTSHEKGQVIFNVPNSRGDGAVPVRVPDTWIPYPVTEHCTKNQLISSTDFRKSINARRLVIIDSKDAEKILESKAAQKELDRIYKEEENIRNNVMDLDQLHVEITDTTGGMRDAINEITGEKTLEELVKPSVLQLVADLEEMGDEDGAISTLRNIEKLTTKDYRYIYKQCKKYKEISAYARLQHDTMKEAKRKKKKSK